MRILITAGPTRQYIDTVRFITNASSGQMGYAVAAEAVRRNHEVTLLSGPVALAPPAGCEVVPFVTVSDLTAALGERFDRCDVLVMAAAVGDFQPEKTPTKKIRRGDKAVMLKLIPTEDILASLGGRKKAGQTIVAFALEDGNDKDIEEKARAKMVQKNADFIVVNTLSAIAADQSRACILCPGGIALPWEARKKQTLAEKIVRLISAGAGCNNL